MPQNVQAAAPSVVMPFSLSSAFSEEQRLEALVNLYQNGFATRSPLAINPRRFWKLSKSLTRTQWAALRNFYLSNTATPFWFYNPRETTPPFSWDASGATIQGRYTVVFDGNWAEDSLMVRSAISFGLREVA
jgi:hypothetical protein